MPRKSPDTVQEMRVTLGNYERQTLTEFNKTLTSVRKTAQIPQYILGGGVVVIGGALGFAAYTIYKYFDLPAFIQNPIESIASVGLDITSGGVFGDDSPINPVKAERDAANAATGKFNSYEEIHARYNGRIEDLEKKIAYMKGINAKSPIPVYPSAVIEKLENRMYKEMQLKKVALRAHTQYLVEQERFDEVRPREGA